MQSFIVIPEPTGSSLRGGTGFNFGLTHPLVEILFNFLGRRGALFSFNLVSKHLNIVTSNCG